MRALIIGVDGAIGRALASALSAAGHQWVGTSRRPDRAPGVLPLDLDTLVGLDALPEADIVYLCAAITRQFERPDPAAARRVNVEAPVSIARALGARGTHPVFLSSNAVFDGNRPDRREDEPPSPTTAYGSDKAEAERGILAAGPATVLRLTKVLTPERPLLPGWIRSLAARTVVRPIHDMCIAPLALEHVTAALLALGECRAQGIFHQSAARDISYADVAYHLAARLGADPALVQPWSRIESGIPGSGWGTYTCLSTERLTWMTGFHPPDPCDVLGQVFGLPAAVA